MPDEDGPTRTPQGATLPGAQPPVPPGAAPPAEEREGGSHSISAPDPYGEPGRPVRKNGPFYWGFVGALGALTGYFLIQLVGQLSQVITLVGVSAFLAIGLDPLVRWLQRRGLGRGSAVAIVFVLLILVVAGFAAAVLPVVIKQIADFSTSLPDTVTSLQNTELFKRLDEEYGVVQRAGDEVRKRVTSGETVTTLFGGLLGAGRAVLSGFTSTVTVLVLTLYFLAALPKILDAGYRLVPASRRPRVRALGDEIVRRIGGYVAGQTTVAFINAVLTYILLLVLDIPYPAVLAITVGLLGLIPLIGATLGAIVVILVGLTQSWQTAAIAAVYYLIYQQVENYVIAPRIMSRTVAVPGAIALIAALAGGSLLGILGALISIPIAAAILLIVQEVWLPRQEQT